MLTRPLFILQLVTLSVLAVIHISALNHALYFFYPWLDILTHFLGGLWVGLFVLWCAYDEFSAVFKYSRTDSLVLVSISIFTIAIGWELFEVFAGIDASTPGFALDTAIDIVMGTIGTMCAWGAVALGMITTISHE